MCVKRERERERERGACERKGRDSEGVKGERY